MQRSNNPDSQQGWKQFSSYVAGSNVIRGALAAIALGCVASTNAADVLVKGQIKREYYPNATRATINAGTAGTPTISYLNTFQAPTGVADNYGQRLSGLFIPAVTGSYVFFISADDSADLYLSTDANPANKRIIAQEANWSDPENWTASGGASPLEQKRSDQFSPDAGATTPFANGISLVAGTPYYIEAVHQEGNGGDNLGATFKLIAEPDPEIGEDTRLRGDLVGVMIPAPTTLTFSSQPQNTTVFAGTSARFVAATQTDSSIPATYQWRRNGVNITGATASSYSFVTSPSDNGATFDVVAVVPGRTNTSSVATLTVQNTGATTVVGSLKREYFPGASRTQVESGAAGAPTIVSALPSFQAPTDFADNYSQRVSGLFTPSVTGEYVFFVSADDDTDLFLSTDSTAANKRLIAQETNWSGPRNWNTPGDAAAPAGQRRSDQWSPDGGTTTPFANGISLIAGQSYYIEAVHHEGGGGDNLAATFKLVSEADPVDGDASRFTNNVISFVTRPSTALTITTQPAATTVTQGKDVTFTVAAQTDSELTPTYQWRRNGVNIAGATGSSYKFTTLAADNNANYDVVVTIPGTNLSATSSAARLTVQSGILAPGLKREFYPGGTRATVASGTLTPTVVDVISNLDLAGGRGNDYGQRITGFFIPPTTGRYVFFIAADDDTDVYLGTNEDPATKRLIVQEASWSGRRNWNTPGDQAAPSQRRSDTWSPDAGVTTPWAEGIQLTAGNRYWLEIIHHQGSGGDNLGLTYKLINEADPVDGEATRMTGSVLGFYATASTVTITQQPASTTVVQNRPVTLSVAATTTSEFPTLFYQWQRNGVDIAGATGATYTIPVVSSADNNAQYTVKVSAAGSPVVTSQAAVLTVTADTTAPTVVSAGAFSGGTSVGLAFNELMDQTTASASGSYTVSGATVTGATLIDGRVVQLQLASPVGANFTVNVTGVKDLAGNTIAPATVTGQVVNLTATDIGDPVMVGNSFTWGSGAVVNGGGADIWNNADSFYFVSRPVTGSFDVRARVDSLTGVNEWTKAGLMARETLDAGSRNQAVITTRNTGNGVNVTTYQWRDETDGASGSMADAQRQTPVVYPNWIRLVRETATSNELKGYWSRDGVTWNLLATHTTPGAALPATLHVGMAVTSHDNAADAPLATGVFENFSIAPFSNVTPARLSISQANGQITISWQGSGVLEATESLTAPNWQAVTGVTGATYTTTATGSRRFFRVRAQ